MWVKNEEKPHTQKIVHLIGYLLQLSVLTLETRSSCRQHLLPPGRSPSCTQCTSHHPCTPPNVPRVVPFPQPSEWRLKKYQENCSKHTITWNSTKQKSLTKPSETQQKDSIPQSLHPTPRSFFQDYVTLCGWSCLCLPLKMSYAKTLYKLWCLVINIEINSQPFTFTWKVCRIFTLKTV